MPVVGSASAKFHLEDYRQARSLSASCLVVAIGGEVMVLAKLAGAF